MIGEFGDTQHVPNLCRFQLRSFHDLNNIKIPPSLLHKYFRDGVTLLCRRDQEGAAECSSLYDKDIAVGIHSSCSSCSSCNS